MLGLGQSCKADADCDPGDFCERNECGSALTRLDATVSLAPSSGVIHERPGNLPAAVEFVARNQSGATLAVTAACAPNGAITPTSGTIEAGKDLAFSVQAPTQSVSGTHLIRCALTSAGSMVAEFVTSVTFAGRPGSGGGGGGGTTGPIGPTGGTVDLLDFVVTGDTRPPTCNDVAGYPAAVHAQIVQSMAAVQPQLGLDLGDHMYACGAAGQQSAQPQMDLYVKGLAGFPALFLMTMGNHECDNGQDCSTRPDDPNWKAFSAALGAVSKQSEPNYALQIQTRHGRVTLVVIADNYFGPDQRAWLERVLSDADSGSKATLIAKHHPVTGSRSGPPAPWQIAQNHKYTLVMTAHDHKYTHSTSTLGGRTVICGLGGANASHTGFCRVQQGADGKFSFTQYDVGGNPGDTWSVDPQ